MKKIENMKNWEVSNGLVMSYEMLDDKYVIEDEITMAEKIDIIDTLVDLPISSVIDLIKKFVEDYESGIIKKAPCNYYDNIVNTNSLKAWIKRNNAERNISTDGILRYLTVRTNICNFILDKWRDTITTPESFVDAAFHSLLNILKEKEEKYYFENSEENAYIGKVCDLVGKYCTKYGYGYRSNLTGDSYYITAEENSESMRNSIFIENKDYNNSNKRALSIEEIKDLENCLNAIETDYQQSLDRIQQLEEELNKEKKKKEELLNKAIITFEKNIEVK